VREVLRAHTADCRYDGQPHHIALLVGGGGGGDAGVVGAGGGGGSGGAAGPAGAARQAGVAEPHGLVVFHDLAAHVAVGHASRLSERSSAATVSQIIRRNL
jgi:hypothetical protein